MKVYALETSESDYQRFETGLADGLTLYFDRATAQEECDKYNAEFQDEDEFPAHVVELDVVGTPVSVEPAARPELVS